MTPTLQLALTDYIQSFWGLSAKQRLSCLTDLVNRERRKAAESALRVARAKAMNKPRYLSPQFCEKVIEDLFPAHAS